MNSHNFQVQRPKLLKLAYRMLGSFSAAEDVVQETWLRCEKQKSKLADLEQDSASSSSAYIFRITTNLCIDFLRKRQQQMQHYKGPWLPEPIETLSEADSSKQIEFADEFSIGLLLMLEALKPNERAVLVLKEALDFDHDAIAEMLDIQTDNSRQLLRRARQKLEKASAGQYPAALNTSELERKQHRSVLEQFVTALAEADTTKVISLMTEDAIAYSDGGGIVQAALIPLEGPQKISQVFQHLAQKNQASTQLTWSEFNSQTGLVLSSEAGIESVITVEVKNDLIHRIFMQRNPHKIAHLHTIADVMSS